MKKTTIGVFATRKDAEKFIDSAHNNLSIPNDDISYVYRNTDGEVREVKSADVSTITPAEGAAKGATGGALIGAIAGLATIAGLIPVVGPIFVAGPLVTALGLTGGVGVTAAGAATGAAVGGLAGALIGLGTNRERAKEYEDLVLAGNILVAVYAKDHKSIQKLMSDNGAMQIETYEVNV